MAGHNGRPRMLVNADGSYEFGSKAWAERQIIGVIKQARSGQAAGLDPVTQPPIQRDPKLVLAAVTVLARLKGWIVEKRQGINAKLDLTKLSPADLRAMLTTHLDQLDPASRAQVESIAAGEYDMQVDPED